MILRSLDKVADAERAGTPIQCTTCREIVEPGTSADRGEDMPRSPCCGSPVYLVERATPTLAEQLGPAWETFIPVPPVLLAQRELTAGAKIVAQVLLDHRNLEDVFPSQETIAGLAGMSRKAAGRALAELESAGLIARARRSKSNGARTSDLIDVGPLVPGLNRLNVETQSRPKRRFDVGGSAPDLNVESTQGPYVESTQYQEVEKDQELEEDLDEASPLRDDGRQEDLAEVFALPDEPESEEAW